MEFRASLVDFDDFPQIIDRLAVHRLFYSQPELRREDDLGFGLVWQRLLFGCHVGAVAVGLFIVPVVDDIDIVFRHFLLGFLALHLRHLLEVADV